MDLPYLEMMVVHHCLHHTIPMSTTLYYCNDHATTCHQYHVSIEVHVLLFFIGSLGTLTPRGPNFDHDNSMCGNHTNVYHSLYMYVPSLQLYI